MLNLKNFSLICNNETDVYDEVVIPFLQRMSNLEKLTLCLVIECQERFIDGDNLKKNIVNYMPKLNDFLFNIRSIISLDNQMLLLSNDDIQRTLTNLTNHQVNSCVDYFSNEKSGHCHIYTYPYTMIYYENITNNFPGGLFKYVQTVKLFDECPFEHMFFIRIAQAFPFLKYLTVSNWQPQNDKQHQKANDDHRKFSIIEYPHLITLHLLNIHDDYAEQFLLDEKTCLPNDIQVIVDYDLLQRVTYNFTRNATRINYSKVKYFQFHDQTDLSKYI